MATLGPLRPRVWLMKLLKAPQTAQMECRLAWRSVHCPPKDQPHGWAETVGAGARKVRLLLRFAQVECLPSWAPPISMNTLSAVVEHQAISCPAHCLLSQSNRLWDRRGKPSLRSAMKGGKLAGLSPAVAGHPNRRHHHGIFKVLRSACRAAHRQLDGLRF